MLNVVWSDYHLKSVPKVRVHLRSRQKAKKQCKKTWKNTFFLVFFFHFCLDRSKCNPWRNLYFFNFWGTCCKKKHNFLHFFWHFFHFPPHFTKQKNAWQIQKKCVVWHFTLHYSTKKVFFNIFFTFFWRTKFQFLIFPHIITNSIFFVFYAHPTANS